MAMPIENRIDLRYRDNRKEVYARNKRTFQKAKPSNFYWEACSGEEDNFIIEKRNRQATIPRTNKKLKDE